MAPLSSFAGSARFEISAVLGEGATGKVYRVLDRETSRDVALKTLRLPAAEALLRLKREFRTRAGITHPNLLQFHELFVEDERCFFTMEAVEGVDFLHWVRGELGLRGVQGSTLEGSTASTDSLETPSEPAPPSRLPLSEPVPVAAPRSSQGTAPPSVENRTPTWEPLRRGLDQLFQALQSLHGEGLVHRDVKPSNVMVTPQGRRAHRQPGGAVAGA